MPTGLRAVIRRFLMMMSPRQLCLVLTSLTAIGAVAAAPATSMARTCGNVTLGQKNSGHTVTLHRCERLTIRLKQAFDGGYSWKVARRPAPSILKLVSDKTVAPTPKGAVGGTDTRLFVFRAVGKGKTSLRLTEGRPFVPHSQIAKFTLFVRVS